MAHHLVLLSVGPVQSFIAQARKLRDLRSGSQLLSELIKAPIRHFQKSGGTIIVPGDPDSDSLPNRTLGTIEGLTDGEAIALAQELAQITTSAWDEVHSGVWKKLPSAARQNEDWKRRYHEQLDQSLDVYWAVEPYGSSEDYPIAYKNIEARLGAVKNVRAFAQIGSSFGGDETSRKDALTGERDALLFGASGDSSKFPATVDPDLAYRLPSRGVLTGPNEGLSAISAVKRLRDLDVTDDFYSTADVAIMGVRSKLPDGGAYSYKTYYEELSYHRRDGEDGQLVYEENLTPAYFKKQGLDVNRLPQYREKHRDLRKTLRAAGLRQTSYYAVLAFDGDNIGAWLSGKYLGESVAGATLMKFHEAIGQYLSAFAQQARHIVDDAGYGVTVYAGGDDYLGLLTLDNLFAVLQDLRLAFKKTVSDPLKTAYQVKEDFTFSAGVVIAHYKRPLGDTVQLARKAEKAAKDFGRDALCIRVVKRSGEQQQALLPWALDSTGTFSKTLATLQSLAALLQGRFGRTWLTESTRTVYQLFGKGSIDTAGREMLEAELLRLLQRTLDSGGAVTAAERQEATHHLRALVGLTANSENGNARNLVYALQVIDFCKREMNTLDKAQTAVA